MNLSTLEKISEITWCRRCLVSKKTGNCTISLDKIMSDNVTMFQVFIEYQHRDCVAEFDNLKEAFTEYELRA